MLTVGEALHGAAIRYKDKKALVFGEQSLTFTELDNKTNQIARALLGLGLKKGQRVGLLLPNGLDMAEAYFGLAKAGLVGVPINLRWSPDEIRYALMDSQISLIVADKDLRSALSAVENLLPVYYTHLEGEDRARAWEDLVSQADDSPLSLTISEEDPWVIVYTSGTTGKPKGAVRSHVSNLMIALTLVAELGISSDDIGLAVLPMFHVNSLWVVTLSVIIGATCVIYPHRSIHPQHIVDEMNKHQVTYSMFVPTLLSFLADAVEAGKLDAQTLRVILTASAPLDSTLRDRILLGFPQVRLYDIYGATEYGACTVIRHRLNGPLGSVGYPIIGQSIRILDDQRQALPAGEIGEVFVKGPSLMKEYFNNPQATRESFTSDGYLTVGDMGYISEEGLLYLVDRKQDMIITSGENVYPVEVEEVLSRSPDVAMATVFGIPDARRGERVVALVVPRANHTIDVDSLHELAKTLLADYKRPYVIDVVDSLPIGPSGKVVRRLAKQQWLQEHSNETNS
ncbi:AMP-binding enzyme C-terminal domain-containing protein [Sulfobacillus thermosulfidooxidans DSM 9293]|uniref:AMP-binding enzyme C-terminal domain-containing protein n=1 Tax=Sulfobacillus thermosulfidooxidans (strain DSM 9293 / VKM B-1269 / AT-1) TaxID=929705 RepID=A0A1W1WM13_SULTA|nr:class I adenylate-forming enzyme family protein [Sulfobacillus thermosulfidooxidans]SMC07337.1 AMP-binding enzyme C-terminal domain-containing protein [Sulfobacillus thermosulfidooxidans DSM 9293]